MNPSRALFHGALLVLVACLFHDVTAHYTKQRRFRFSLVGGRGAKGGRYSYRPGGTLARAQRRFQNIFRSITNAYRDDDGYDSDDNMIFGIGGGAAGGSGGIMGVPPNFKMSDLPGYLSSGVFDPRSPPGNLGAIIIGDQFPTRIVDPLPVNRIGFNDMDDNTFFSGQNGISSPADTIGGGNVFGGSDFMGGTQPGAFGGTQLGGNGAFGNANVLGGTNTFGTNGNVLGGTNTFGGGNVLGGTNTFGTDGNVFGGSNTFGGGNVLGGTNTFGTNGALGGPNTFGGGNVLGGTNTFGGTQWGAGVLGGGNTFGGTQNTGGVLGGSGILSGSSYPQTGLNNQYQPSGGILGENTDPLAGIAGAKKYSECTSKSQECFCTLYVKACPSTVLNGVSYCCPSSVGGSIDVSRGQCRCIN